MSELHLINAHEVAAMLRVHRKTLSRLLAAGRLPAPVTPGNQQLWDRDEIVRWVKAGCPSRAEWEARRDTDRKPARR